MIQEDRLHREFQAALDAFNAADAAAYVATQTFEQQTRVSGGATAEQRQAYVAAEARAEELRIALTEATERLALARSDTRH